MTRNLLIIALLFLPVTSLAGQAGTGQADQTQFFKNRSEGMSAISREIEALKQLIRVVQSLPEERGRHRIAFNRLLTDLDLMQKGVLETINLPTTVPVQGVANYPALFSDYLE